MSISQLKKTVSAKVDQSTHEAFFSVCQSLGTNANQLLTALIERFIDDPQHAPIDRARSKRLGNRQDGHDLIYLDEILKHARIASLMAAAIAEQIDPLLWENALADVDKEADRFVKKLGAAPPANVADRPRLHNQEALS